MKRLVIACTLLSTVVGCGSFAENRKVTVRRAGVADASSTAITSVSTLWWRAKDTGGAESLWNAFVPPPTPADPIDQDLKFFENNVIRWPEKMPPPYKPVKSKENKKNAAIMKRLEELLPKSEQEVY